MKQKKEMRKMSFEIEVKDYEGLDELCQDRDLRYSQVIRKLIKMEIAAGKRARGK